MKTLTLIVAAVLALPACRTQTPETGTVLLAAEVAQATVRSEMKLPLTELSGLAVSGNRGLLAVGDHDPIIVRAELAVDLRSAEAKAKKLNDVFSGTDGKQWEGIAVDGKGRVIVLQESPPRLFVLDSGLSQVEKSVKLDVADLPAQLLGGDNSLGEGLVLMRNGHVLVVKEKNPTVLIEFGPSGEQAVGVSAETLLGPGEEMLLQGGGNARLKPLKWWTLGDSSIGLLKDVSELAVGPNGVLYVLSDESRRFARLEARLKVDEKKFALKQVWDLPAAVENPEGLAFLGNVPVVGSDRKDDTKNLFVLDPVN